MNSRRWLAVVALIFAGSFLAGSGVAQTAPAEPPTGAVPAGPPQQQPPRDDSRFQPNEIIDAGHRFFGGVSRGLAMVVEKAVSQWGLPNGYVLGEEAGDVRVFWQGPTLGFDAGADGARIMMLVYNLPRTTAIFDRFGGLDGSAYFIGGFGMTALTANNIVLVPIRSVVGLRLGANRGYLKFRQRPTWNPF